MVTASGSLSNSHGKSATTTLSPTSYTTGNSSQSISVNDTTAEALTITVSGNSQLLDRAVETITGNTGAMTIVPTTTRLSQ